MAVEIVYTFTMRTNTHKMFDDRERDLPPTRAPEGPPVAGWAAAPVAPIVPRSAGHTFLSVYADVVVCTTTGGGACGILSLGFVSILFAPISGLVGLVAGLALGVVIGLVVAAIVVWKADPPIDPHALVAGLELTGIVVALAVVAPMHAAGWLTRTPGEPHGSQLVLWILNSVLALLAVGYVGFHWGRALAARHLRRYGLEAPETLPFLPRPAVEGDLSGPGARPGRRTSR
jgi:hypothetical protein